MVPSQHIASARKLMEWYLTTPRSHELQARSTVLNASGHQPPNFESSHNIILCLFALLFRRYNSPFVRIPTSKQLLEESSLLLDDTSFCIFYRHLVNCLHIYQNRMDGYDWYTPSSLLLIISSLIRWYNTSSSFPSSNLPVGFIVTCISNMVLELRYEMNSDE